MKFVNGMTLDTLLHPVGEVVVHEPIDNGVSLSPLAELNQQLSEQNKIITELKEQTKASSEIANTVKDYASAFIIAKAQGIDFFG